MKVIAGSPIPPSYFPGVGNFLLEPDPPPDGGGTLVPLANSSCSLLLTLLTALSHCVAWARRSTIYCTLGPSSVESSGGAGAGILGNVSLNILRKYAHWLMNSCVIVSYHSVSSTVTTAPALVGLGVSVLMVAPCENPLMCTTLVLNLA